MRVAATYEHGSLRPERPLALKEGERVELIVVHRTEPGRWDLVRLGAAPDEDQQLSESGLAAWADGLDAEDRR